MNEWMNEGNNFCEIFESEQVYISMRQVSKINKEDLHLLNGVEEAAVASDVRNVQELSDGGGDRGQRLAWPRWVEGQSVGLAKVEAVGRSLDDDSRHLLIKKRILF